MTRERIVETWEGLSPSRGLVRVNLTVTDPTPIYEGTEWVESVGGLMVQQPRRVGWQGGGAGYDGTCEDGKPFEVFTIALGSVERARRFCFEMAHACKDVPEWRCVSVVLCGIVIEAPSDDRSWPEPITPRLREGERTIPGPDGELHRVRVDHIGEVVSAIEV